MSLENINAGRRLPEGVGFGAGFGHWRSDRKGKRIVWSPEMYRIAGVSPDVIPSPELIRSLHHPDDLDRVELAMAETLRTGSMEPMRLRWVRTDGAIIDVEMTAQMDGPATVIGIVREISGDIETERALAIARAEIRAADRVKSELLAAMRSEVRAPISQLLGGIDKLQQESGRTRWQPLVDELAHAAGLAIGAIDEMHARFDRPRPDPAESDALPCGDPGPAPPAAAPNMRMHILLAEDNPINRRLMAGLLTREGHQVVAVENGRLALGAIAAQPFDLVLMDMQMPELDGLSAIRAIRALGPPLSRTPILAISADSQPERQQLCFEAGADSFLPKPIVAGQLLGMMARMRRAAPVADNAGGDRLDRKRMDHLIAQAGHDDAAILMRMLLLDVSDRPRRIAAAARAGAWDLAAAEGEALRTLLEGFGNFGLSRLLVSVSRQCRRCECPPAVLDEMLEHARRLAAVLNAELGSFAAAPAEATA